MRNLIPLFAACFLLTGCGDKEQSGNNCDGSKMCEAAHQLKPADRSKDKSFSFK